MSEGAAIVRGALASAGGFAIRLGARFGFLFVAARLYGHAALGAYAVALAVLEIGVIAGGVGSRWLVFRWLDAETDRPPRHVLADVMLLVTGASGAVGTAVLGAVMLAPAGLIAPASRVALAMLAPVIVVQALIELLLAATRWTGAVRWEVTAKSVLQPYLQLALGVGALCCGWTRIGLPLSYALASIATLGFAHVGAARCLPAAPGYRIMRARVLAMLRDVRVNGANDLIDALATRADLYLVGLMLGEVAAGIYAVPRQIAIVLRQARQSADTLLVPAIARRAAAGIADARAATRALIAVQAPIVLVLALAGAPLLAAFGDPHGAGYGVLVTLALAEAVQGAFGVGDLLLLYRRPGWAIGLTLGGIAVALGVAITAFPHWGIAGAAAAMLAGQTTRAIGRALLLRRLSDHGSGRSGGRPRDSSIPSAAG